jgi:hypothetical protein
MTERHTVRAATRKIPTGKPAAINQSGLTESQSALRVAWPRRAAESRCRLSRLQCVELLLILPYTVREAVLHHHMVTPAFGKQQHGCVSSVSRVNAYGWYTNGTVRAHGESTPTIAYTPNSLDL